MDVCVNYIHIYKFIYKYLYINVLYTLKLYLKETKQTNKKKNPNGIIVFSIKCEKNTNIEKKNP